VNAGQIAEFVVAPALIAFTAIIPVLRSIRKQRSLGDAEHNSMGERITKLEAGHEYAFEFLKESMAYNGRVLEKLDDKLDALSLVVAKSGGYERRGE